jgi:hypothetical protein
MISPVTTHTLSMEVPSRLQLNAVSILKIRDKIENHKANMKTLNKNFSSSAVLQDRILPRLEGGFTDGQLWQLVSSDKQLQ